MPDITDREKRVGLQLPLDVSGLDVVGTPFSESTRSVNVSGGGFCFDTSRKLAVGSRVTVHRFPSAAPALQGQGDLPRPRRGLPRGALKAGRWRGGCAVPGRGRGIETLL
jgi:hypothetical protein